MKPIFRSVEAQLASRAEELARQHAPVRSPRGPRRIRLVAGFTAVAASATAVALFVGIGTGGRVDPVARAEAALSASDEIIHIVTSTRSGPGNDLGASTTAEQWSTVRPLRWRIVKDVPAPTSPGADREEDQHGLISGPVQYAYANGTLQFYAQRRGTLDVTSGLRGTGLAARVPGPEGAPNLGEPLTEIRSALSSGRLHADGKGTVDGRPVERLSGTIPVDPDRDGPEGIAHPTGLEYDVDPSTFAPVRIRVQTRLGVAQPGDPPIVTEIRFSSFERLPVTAKNERLLAIRSFGTPKVFRHTAGG
jgi:hypothetical protein